MEHKFFRCILSQCEFNDILTDLQHGFRRKRSCEYQLLSVTDKISYYTDQGHLTEIILLDFQKALNTIPQQHMVTDLGHHGSRCPVIAWLKCFLTHHT